MTTLNTVEVTCALCGHQSEHITVGSTNSFGPPDLDLRPPEMQRSTISYWIQSCPECGYSAPDISESIDGASELIQTSSYRKQREDTTFPDLANSFLCHAMILESLERYPAAGWNALHAAWACDDARSEDKARTCRQRAASLFTRARGNAQEFGEMAGTEEALMTDLLRRSGQFQMAKAMSEAGLKVESEGVIADVLRFQQALIDREDTNAYTLEDAATGDNHPE